MYKGSKRAENQYGSSHGILQMKSMHATIMDMDFRVWLMFYSHAVLKSLYVVLQEMIDECTGRGVYFCIVSLPLQSLQSHSMV